MTPAREDGDLVLLLVDDATGTAYAGTETGSKSWHRPRSVANGAVTAAEGYDVLTGAELVGIDQELSEVLVPAGEDRSSGPRA